jgi:GTP-binding protein YchF
MQLGILGLSKAGKTTLFNLLTGSSEETGKFGRSAEAHLAVARVPDSRLVALRDLYQPKKYSPATVEYVDIPGIQRDESRENLDLTSLKTVDALVHVVRAFEDSELLHPEGSVDPLRDVESIDLELILSDLELVERRLQKLEQAKKRGLQPEEIREQSLLSETILPTLENEKSLRTLSLEAEDERRLRGFQLLSAKPLLVVFNVGEDEIGASGATGSSDTAAPHLEEEPQRRQVVMSAPIEAEISALPLDEQAEFLSDLGLTEPSVDRVVRASYDLLGLISFFTVGEDEVKAWTIRRGTAARKAAGAVHTDIERGFIRAETVGWEDLVRLGSTAACREQALLRLEGKEYVVQDGDVMNFRFNI